MFERRVEAIWGMKNMVLAIACLVASMVSCAQTPDVIEAQVKNADIKLSTKLKLPSNPISDQPPVLIIVHGSGKNATWNDYQQIIDRFVNIGVAVAFFDKRGTGESGGKYQKVDVKRSTQSFELMSSDVAAVANWVSTRKEIDGDRVGILGISQGGWIGPLAVSKSDQIDFSIIISGPVCSLGHEKLFSDLAGDEKTNDKISFDEVNQKIRDFNGQEGFNSYSFVTEMDIPSLWLFGEKDRSMPVQFSKASLDKIITDNPGKKFTYKVYPNANHGLIDIDTEVRKDYMLDIKTWIEKELY